MNEFDSALEEFNYISSHTDGAHGCQFESSNGYEFRIWLSNPEDIPQPENDMIRWEVENYESNDMPPYKFSMTLPYHFPDRKWTCPYCNATNTTAGHEHNPQCHDCGRRCTWWILELEDMVEDEDV